MTNTQSVLLVAVCVIAVVGGGGLIYFTWWIAGKVDNLQSKIDMVATSSAFLIDKRTKEIEALKLETSHFQNQIKYLQK